MFYKVCLSALLSICISTSIYSQNRLSKERQKNYPGQAEKVESNHCISTPAPSDAIVLLGKDTEFSQWEPELQEEDKIYWRWSKEGVATVYGGAGSILTKQEFGDVQLHLEWKTPENIDAMSQRRGNSGVVLQRRYEVQILDSYNTITTANGQAGSIYHQYKPSVNPSRKPGEWQSYDIFFTAPKFDGDSLLSPAYITVIHNGVLIHNHVEIQGKTKYWGTPEYKPHGKDKIKLQEHGDAVSFRNVWIREL